MYTYKFIFLIFCIPTNFNNFTVPVYNTEDMTTSREKHWELKITLSFYI